MCVYFKKKGKNYNEEHNTNIKNNHKNFYNILFFYILLMFVFAIIFFLAYINLNKKINLFGIKGLPAEFEDWMIMILSIGSMIKIVVDLYKLNNK